MKVFEDERVYDDSDCELDLIATKTKRAQWRHRRFGPAWVKLGRKVKYLGHDLNAYIEENRVSPSDAA
jgi:hypothetical protein